MIHCNPGDEVSCLFAQGRGLRPVEGRSESPQLSCWVLRTLDLLVSDVEVLLLLLFALSAAWRLFFVMCTNLSFLFVCLSSLVCRSLLCCCSGFRKSSEAAQTFLFTAQCRCRFLQTR